jgi:hypothetical protein
MKLKFLYEYRVKKWSLVLQYWTKEVLLVIDFQCIQNEFRNRPLLLPII